MVLVVGAAVAAGWLATGTNVEARAVAAAGADLTRLLRAMALLKLAVAAAAGAVVLWRLGAPVTLPWFVSYALACGAMAAGPGLIWGMAHVALGALLLHGGLLAVGLLLWRDPVVAARLAAIIRTRRAALQAARR